MSFKEGLELRHLALEGGELLLQGDVLVLELLNPHSVLLLALLPLEAGLAGSLVVGQAVLDVPLDVLGIVRGGAREGVRLGSGGGSLGSGSPGLLRSRGSHGRGGGGGPATLPGGGNNGLGEVFEIEERLKVDVGGGDVLHLDLLGLALAIALSEGGNSGVEGDVRVEEDLLELGGLEGAVHPLAVKRGGRQVEADGGNGGMD